MMLPIRTTVPTQATVHALVVSGFCALITLAFFVGLLATMVPAVDRWDTPTAAMMVLVAGISTFWLAHGLHRQIRGHDSTSPPTRLMGRQLTTFGLALRVPLAVFAAGLLARWVGSPPAWFWTGGVPVALWGPQIVHWLFKRRRYHTDHLRGTRILTATQLREAVGALQRTGGELLNWCGIGIPETLASSHFALVGSTASGKTVAMRLLMQSILPNFRPGRGRRALIYDAKQEILEVLHGMPLRCPVVLLNPFDARSSAWDMACDITTFAIALQVAYTLIPEEQGNNAFFVKAARGLLAAVFIAFHLTRPGRWTLVDVVLTLSDTRRTARLLTSVPQTRHIAREYFERDPRTLANTQATIHAHMSMLMPVAALWARSPDKISLTQWATEDYILVLGNDETLRGPLDALNRVIFQRVTELVLAQSESRRRRSWFFLDEVKEAGKLDGLSRLMTKGRSKGARVVLAWQTIEGLRDVYGEKLADELAGMCSNKAFLRTDSPATAQWAAQALGEHELSEWTQSVQWGFQSSSKSLSQHIVKREAVLASQLLHLPPATSRYFMGFFVTPGIGVYPATVHFAHRLWPRGRIANFVPRPPEHQYLADEASPAESGDEQHHPLDDIGPVGKVPHDGFDTADDDDDDGRFYVESPV